MALTIILTSLIFIFYSFGGYPILLWLLSRFKRKTIARDKIYPSVSVVIPVHDEEKIIGEKIRNCLQADYPKEKLKVIVSSDSSTDRTEEIVRQFPSEYVNFLPVPFRGGKVVAQNFALNYCSSEIVIFTDVAISVDRDAIKKIVENFHDPSIGTVSCRDAIIGNENEIQGEGGYIRYDMMVRSLTTQIGSLIGVTGGFYATRLQIAKGGWNPAYPPDFYVALRTIKRGLRVVEDSRVKAHYKTAYREWDELPRKVRTFTRGMTALLSAPNRCMLNPFRYGIISLELLSHKLFRWALPFFLVALLVSNIFLVANVPLSAILLYFQLAFYILCLVSFYGSEQLRQWRLLKIIFYFTIANVALVYSWFGIITGKKYTKWQPTKR